MSLLQNDIDNHVTERFQKWLKDSVDTYRIAELPFEDALGHISYVTLLSSATAMVSLGVGSKAAHEALDLVLGKVLRERNKMKKTGQW